MNRNLATNRRLGVLVDYPNSMCSRCCNCSRCSKAFQPVFSLCHQIGGYVTGCVHFEEFKKKVKKLHSLKDDKQLVFNF